MPSDTGPSRPAGGPLGEGGADRLCASLAAAAEALGLAGRRVLVAASGGLDSTLLAAALQRLAPDLGLSLALGHVNHGLRGAGSDADEAAVRALGAALEIPVAVRPVAPAALQDGTSSRTRPTLQEAARRLRYDALEELRVAARCDVVATAHHLDDQAETVLMRLLRGAGPDGLGGIPERSPDGRIVRPLLEISRSEIEHQARAWGLSWREDPSNRDRHYARARLRRDWLPGLGEAFNPRWLRAIGNLAEAQRRDSEWIETQVQNEAASRLIPIAGGLRICVKGWEGLAPALSRRLLREALRRLGMQRDVSRRHLERMEAFLRDGRPGRAIELPGGLSLRCTAGEFLLTFLSGKAPYEC
jgi:tRNA(Ile)-lysidine synthase